MALTQAQIEGYIDAIDASAALDHVTVILDGREVTLRTMAERMAARAHFVQLLSRQIGRPKQTVLMPSKGFS